MKLLDKFIGFFAPFDCLGCGEEGALICGYCAGLFPDVPERCYRCRRLGPGSVTCPGCRKTVRLSQVIVVTDYEGVAKQLIWRLKYGNTAAAAGLIARLMAARLKNGSAAADYVVPVPTTPGRARSRGYDQAVLIARRLSAETGVPLLDCLARLGKSRQVGASRQLRLRQLKSAFRLKHGSVANTRLLLVDDVLTTGATLEAAAGVLSAGGAKQIKAVVFAQP